MRCTTSRCSPRAATPLYRVLFGAVATVALSTIIACGSATTSSDNIRIGVIYSLRGDQASLDTNSLQGALLAADEINAHGGIRGTPVSLEVRDAKTSSTVAAEQASQLYRDDGVSIVVGLSDTDLASPVAELSEALGTIFVTSGATGPILVQAGSHSTFLACFSDSTQASAAAHYASRTLRARSVDVMYDSSSEYAQTLAGSFSSTFAQNGGNVSSRTTFQGNSTISSATTKRVANSHGDIIFLAGQPDEVAQIIKTLRYAGITKPIIGGDSYDSSRIYDLSPSEKTNVYFTTHTLLTRTPTTPQIESFVQRYTEAYGEPPTSAFAALGYDSINLVAKAVEIAGSTEPNSVRTALESIRNFPAVTGAISYGPNRHIPSKEVTIVTFKEGIATLAGTMTSGS